MTHLGDALASEDIRIKLTLFQMSFMRVKRCGSLEDSIVRGANEVREKGDVSRFGAASLTAMSRCLPFREVQRNKHDQLTLMPLTPPSWNPTPSVGSDLELD